MHAGHGQDFRLMLHHPLELVSFHIWSYHGLHYVEIGSHAGDYWLCIIDLLLGS